jgi:hypothetical protein
MNDVKTKLSFKEVKEGLYSSSYSYLTDKERKKIEVILANIFLDTDDLVRNDEEPIINQLIK